MPEKNDAAILPFLWVSGISLPGCTVKAQAMFLLCWGNQQQKAICNLQSAAAIMRCRIRQLLAPPR